MKKLLLVLYIVLCSLSAFSQSEISYGISYSYQVKESGKEEWSGWIESPSPILIYMDLGFGFIAIENGFKDRFIIKELVGKYSEDNFDVTEMICSDKEKKECTIEIIKFYSGNTALIIKYIDVYYSYLVLKDNGLIGYPFQYFKKDIDDSNSKKFNEKTL